MQSWKVKQEAASDGSGSSAEHGVDMEEQMHGLGAQSEVPFPIATCATLLRMGDDKW